MKNLEWIRKIREAIDNDRFVPYYQGIRNNKTGEIDKYECLVRLQCHESGRLCSPYEFLSYAEDANLLPPMTQKLFQKICKDMQGTSHHFTINISGSDLIHPDFLTLFQQTYTKYEIDPRRITIEILEKSLTLEGDGPIATLKKLRELGCQIALDDFGVEGSNWSRVALIRPHFIKIDGTFIQNLVHQDPEKAAENRIIVESMVHTAHRLGCEAVAEFVKSSEIQAIVEELGIDYSQGYLFSEPSPLAH